jgi:hypothetical protein
MERAHESTTSASVRVRPHPVYFAGTAGWVAFVALATALIVRHNDLTPAANWVAAGWGTLAAFAGVIGPVLRWLRTSIELDAASARCTTGIVWRSTFEVALEDAREMEIDQSYVGRRLGYGYLRIVDDTGATHVLPPIGDLGVWRAAVSRRDRRPSSRRG